MEIVLQACSISFHKSEKMEAVYVTLDLSH